MHYIEIHSAPLGELPTIMIYIEIQCPKGTINNSLRRNAQCPQGTANNSLH